MLILGSPFPLDIGLILKPGDMLGEHEFTGVVMDGETFKNSVKVVREATRDEWLESGGREGFDWEWNFFYEMATD